MWPSSSIRGAMRFGQTLPPMSHSHTVLPFLASSVLRSAESLCNPDSAKNTEFQSWRYADKSLRFPSSNTPGFSCLEVRNGSDASCIAPHKSMKDAQVKEYIVPALALFSMWGAISIISEHHEFAIGEHITPSDRMATPLRNTWQMPRGGSAGVS